MKLPIKLQQECGVTRFSIDNARLLLAKYGRLSRIDFRKDPEATEGYIVQTTWPGVVFTFTGFSWGYGGKGPHGLDGFLSMCGIPLRQNNIPIDSNGKTDSTYNFP